MLNSLYDCFAYDFVAEFPEYGRVEAADGGEQQRGGGAAGEGDQAGGQVHRGTQRHIQGSRMHGCGSGESVVL